MGKETKIGLTVLAVLLLIFAVVLCRRLTKPSDETAETTPAGQEKGDWRGGEVRGGGRQIDICEHRRGEGHGALAHHALCRCGEAAAR